MDTVDVYEVLVKQHESMLFAYVLGLVRDPSLAEDVVQEAFVIGYRKLSTLEKKESFAAWLRTIARNAAYGQLRKRHREFPADNAILEGMEDVFHAFDQDRSGETWEERVRIVEDCFQRLPDKLREVCRMHYFEDQSTRQITDLLRIGLDAVKKRLERARDAIRECAEKRLKLEEIG
jgi:RNA polymerase sigma factor (sigma-70 family)